jgi:hypothetical protein
MECRLIRTLTHSPNASPLFTPKVWAFVAVAIGHSEKFVLTSRLEIRNNDVYAKGYKKNLSNYL